MARNTKLPAKPETRSLCIRRHYRFRDFQGIHYKFGAPRRDIRQPQKSQVNTSSCNICRGTQHRHPLVLALVLAAKRLPPTLEVDAGGSQSLSGYGSWLRSWSLRHQPQTAAHHSPYTD